MKTAFIVVALLALASACGDDASTMPTDAGFVDATAVPQWPRALPSTTELGARRGYSIARAILHSHSPISHDACDGEGFVDGQIADEICLAHFRDAACTLHVDILNVTDHASHVGELPFESLFSRRPTDDDVRDEHGALIATRIHCEDGSSTLVTVGSENELMSIGLTKHVLDTSDVGLLEAAYHADGPDGVDAFHNAGALVFVAHTESRDIDYLRTLGADGLEIYNIHANLDLTIRPEWLGLEAGAYIPDLLLFTNAGRRLASDLSFMTFFSENDNDLGKWDTLLFEGHDLTAIGGTDCHENSIAMALPDGERGDSYRRMMRWFSNHLLVTERTYEGQRDALIRHRSYLAFEVFGTPVGFDFYATADATTFEMGELATAGATLHIDRPELSADAPRDPAPTITLRLLRAELGGAVEVATSSEASLTYVATEPGAYRAEVRIVPEHTRPYLGDHADAWIRDVPWIYSNAIRVGDAITR